jgi:hypothetical protein
MTHYDSNNSSNDNSSDSLSSSSSSSDDSSSGDYDENEKRMNNEKICNIFRHITPTKGISSMPVVNGIVQNRKPTIEMEIIGVEQERMSLMAQRDAFLIEKNKFERERREEAKDKEVWKNANQETYNTLVGERNELMKVAKMLEDKLGIYNPLNSRQLTI